MEKEVQAVQHFDNFPLLSNHQTISHQPDKFILDFRGIYPQFSPDGKQSVVISHKVILLDPHIAKQLLSTLKENVERYEKRFGKIKEPQQNKIAEKEMKKQIKVDGVIEKIDYTG
ncbi:MAG: DUF3467 domain-containing protein [Candidatus Woesearchaeota archaeon]